LSHCGALHNDEIGTRFGFDRHHSGCCTMFSSCFLPEPQQWCKRRHACNGPTWFESSGKLDVRQAKDEDKYSFPAREAAFRVVGERPLYAGCPQARIAP
jgi:hypothetical protein